MKLSWRAHHLRQQRRHRLAGQAALVQLEQSVLHQFRQRPQQVGDFLRSLNGSGGVTTCSNSAVTAWLARPPWSSWSSPFSPSFASAHSKLEIS